LANSVDHKDEICLWDKIWVCDLQNMIFQMCSWITLTCYRQVRLNGLLQCFHWTDAAVASTNYFCVIYRKSVELEGNPCSKVGRGQLFL